MQINSLNSTSFGAKISWETKFKYNPQTQKPEATHTCPWDCFDSYDKEIKKLKDQKNAAYRLDTFMATNKEVQSLMEQLPQKGIIDLRLSCPDKNARKTNNPFEHLSVSYMDPSGNLGAKIAEANNMELRDANPIRYQLETCRPVDEEGNINKEQIVGWMQNLVNFFNSGCKINK